MHITNRLIWCTLILFIKSIESIEYKDFGLPYNGNPCLVSVNQTVHIINEHSLSINFSRPWNKTAPDIIKRPNINLSTGSCCLTQSDKLILFPFQQSQPLQVIEDINDSTWNINNNITFTGSQIAIDTFITRSTFISHFATATLNDLIMIFGGNESSTFILNTRNATTYTWIQIPSQPTTPPYSSDSVLYATSRWVLHFRIAMDIVYIDCFDTKSLSWYGTVSSIILSQITKNIQVISLFNNKSGIDSLLIMAIHQQKTSNISVTTTELWEMNISTWFPERVSINKLNTLIQQSNNTQQQQHHHHRRQEDNSDSGSVIVTPIQDEMALFYGGNEQLSFLNTRNLSFVSPSWLTQDIMTEEEEEAGENNNNLAIILGSVLGTLFLILLIILFIWFYKKKKSNSVPPRPNHENNNEKPSPKNRWPLLSNSRAEKEKEKEGIMNRRLEETSPSLSQFTLSPIRRLSPISLLPPSTNAAEPSTSIDATAEDDREITVLPAQEQPKPPKIVKSRFREHFDFHSFPPIHHRDSSAIPSHSLP